MRAKLLRSSRVGRIANAFYEHASQPDDDDESRVSNAATFNYPGDIEMNRDCEMFQDVTLRTRTRRAS